MYYIYELTELTKEEQAEAKRISDEALKRVQELTEKRDKANAAGEDTSLLDAEIWDAVVLNPYLEYLEEAEKRHFNLLGGNHKAIYDDAIGRLPRLIKNDFLGTIKTFKTGEKKARDSKKELEKQLKPEVVKERIQYNLTLHLEELRQDDKLYKKLLAEIEAQIKAYKYDYDIDTAEDPEQLGNELIPTFYGSVLGRRIMPSFHGELSDAYLGITPSLIKNNIDPIANGKSKFNVKGIQIEIEKNPGNMGLNEKMLYLIIRSQLTENNTSRVYPVKNTSVSIPLRAYGEFRDTHVIADKMDTEEEQLKENKRVSDNLRNLRRTVRASLDKMQIIKYKRPNGGGGAITFITDYDVGNDYITVNLRQEFADAIVKEPIEYIPISIGKIPNKNQNSDNILNLALKILEHYTNFKNYRPGVDPGLLSVKTMLEALKTPTYKDLEKWNDTRHWQKKIKDKLDDALETLYSIGFLGEYSYCKTKGAELSDAEYEEMLLSGYDAYVKLNVKFTIKDKVVFTDQLESWRKETRKNVEANRKKTAKKNK
jgi:hypothetical protein